MGIRDSYRIVLETIRQTLSYVRMFRKDFKLEMLAQDEESRKAELAEKQKALSGAKKRMEDLDRIIQHIYEDNVLGKLSDSRYLKLSRQYEKEQAEIEQLAAVLEREIETQAGQVSNVNEFLKLVDKYLDIPELDAAILNELVSRIVAVSYTHLDVYKRQDKAGGDRCCQQDAEHNIPRRKPKRQIVAFAAG